MHHEGSFSGGAFLDIKTFEILILGYITITFNIFLPHLAPGPLRPQACGSIQCVVGPKNNRRQSLAVGVAGFRTQRPLGSWIEGETDSLALCGQACLVDPSGPRLLAALRNFWERRSGSMAIAKKKLLAQWDSERV